METLDILPFLRFLTQFRPMLFLFFLLFPSHITAHANPVIALFPGLGIDTINRVNSRYKCAVICDYVEFDSTAQDYSAIFIAGNSIEDTLQFKDKLTSINETIPIVLVFEKPMVQWKKEITEEITRLLSVTSILGYHSSSPYHIYEDHFDEIKNDLSRPVDSIWLKDLKYNAIVNRRHKAMAVTRHIAFVRNCDINEEVYENELDRITKTLNNFNVNHKFHYILNKVDECATLSAEERLLKLKNQIADYDFFIYDQDKFYDEYYPEIPFIKELSVPIMMYEPAIMMYETLLPKFTTMSNTSLNIVDWSRARTRYYAWADTYTRIPFHGTGVCDICTALSNEMDLTKSQQIDPYFNYAVRPPEEAEAVVERQMEKLNNETNHIGVIGAQIFGGLIGSYIAVTCIIALYFPVSNTIRRYYKRYYLLRKV